METFFASPERAEEDELRRSVTLVSDHALLIGLMQTVNGLLAVFRIPSRTVMA